MDRINGVMVSVLVSSAVDHGFDPCLDYEIDICCFFAKHTALSSKNKDWLTHNHNNVSEWSYTLYPWTVLFQ